MTTPILVLVLLNYNSNIIIVIKNISGRLVFLLLQDDELRYIVFILKRPLFVYEYWDSWYGTDGIADSA